MKESAGRAVRRRLAAALLLVLVSAAFQGASAQQATPADTQVPASGEIVIVAGKVLDSSTGQPIEAVRVVLVRMDRGTVLLGGPMWESELTAADTDPEADRLRTLTGTDGVFRFRIRAAARFQLRIEREGYVDAQEGNFRHIRLEPGQSKDDIVIQLHRQGTIQGQVIDVETRQPLAGLAVWPYHHREVGKGTSPSIGPAGSPATTDEEGRYTIEGLPPGEYYFEVRQPLGASIGDPTPVEDFLHAEEFAYASYWYPGTEVAEQATPVTLVGGGAVDGIDIPIAKRRVASIRGRVLGDENAGEVRLSLTSLRITVGGRGVIMIARGTLSVNSEFQIDGLIPGTYTLNASATTDDLAETRFGSLRFELGDQNMDGLDIPLLSLVTVTGQVRIEGREPEPGQPVLPTDDMAVRLRPLLGGGGPLTPPSATVRAEDGSLEMKAVNPNSYLVTAMKEPAGHKISEVRYNGSVARHKLVSIDPEARAHRLEITLAPASGSVAVTVTDGLRPAAGATVILAPESVDESTETELLIFLLVRVTTDAEGHANIDSLLPGVYRIIAYPEDALWMNDPYLLRRLAGGQEVRVTAGPAMIQIRTEPMP